MIKQFPFLLLIPAIFALFFNAQAIGDVHNQSQALMFAELNGNMLDMQTSDEEAKKKKKEEEDEEEEEEEEEPDC